METDVHKEIARRVATLREAKGLTQEALAEKAALSRSYVARIEGGNRQATVQALSAIATALRVPLWRLFTDTRVSPDEMEIARREINLVRMIRGLRAEDSRLVAQLAKRLQTEPRPTLHEPRGTYGVDDSTE